MLFTLSFVALSWAGSLCNDGSYSPSEGRGTCSWHGGVAADQPLEPSKAAFYKRLREKFADDDRDGVANYLDTDSDRFGMRAATEGTADADKDTTPPAYGMTPAEVATSSLMSSAVQWAGIGFLCYVLLGIAWMKAMARTSDWDNMSKVSLSVRARAVAWFAAVFLIELLRVSAQFTGLVVVAAGWIVLGPCFAILFPLLMIFLTIIGGGSTGSGGGEPPGNPNF